MPVERRLRQGLERNAGVLDPDVARFLDTVVTRSRRRVRVRRVAATVAVAAAAVVVVAIGPRAIDAVRDLRQTQPAQPTPTVTPNGEVLTGTYTRQVDGSPTITENGMAGRWTIQLNADGTITATAPRGYSGVLSGILFETDGDRFRTSVFGQDVCTFLPLGSYRWSRSGGTLSFEVEDDQCEARVEFFTSGSWRSVS